MYYLVRAKCGHVGNRKFIEKDFPVIASSKKEAASIVLKKSRVKKQLNNAITYVIQNNKNKYLEYIKLNKKDLYLNSHNNRNNIYFIDQIKEFDNLRKKKYEFICREERLLFERRKRYYKEELKYEYVY